MAKGQCLQVFQGWTAIDGLEGQEWDIIYRNWTVFFIIHGIYVQSQALII